MQEKDRLTATIVERDKEIQDCKDLVIKEGLEFRKTAIELRDNYNNRLDEIQKEAEQSLTEAKATIEALNKIISMSVKHFEAIRDWDEDSDRYWEDQGECSKDCLRMIEMDLERANQSIKLNR